MLFYLSAVALCSLAILVAKNMGESTCRCIRWCLIMIAVGLVGLVMLVFYDVRGTLRLACMLPILWGITGWLFFDRYRAHEDLRCFRSWISAASSRILDSIRTAGRQEE